MSVSMWCEECKGWGNLVPLGTWCLHKACAACLEYPWLYGQWHCHVMCTAFWSTRIPVTHLHPFLLLALKMLFHGINFVIHSLHICSCIPHYQQLSCQVSLAPRPNTNAPRRLFLYFSFCYYFVSFTDDSDIIICGIEPRNRIYNDIYESHCHLNIGVRAHRVPCKKFPRRLDVFTVVS
jgi:hypothetical protein